MFINQVTNKLKLALNYVHKNNALLNNIHLQHWLKSYN